MVQDDGVAVDDVGRAACDAGQGVAVVGFVGGAVAGRQVFGPDGAGGVVYITDRVVATVVAIAHRHA